MEKILTIVIPTYNMENYLDKCLSSLIVSDENIKQLEVLVVNDGSKDRSSEIAHSYERRFPQTFRVIDKENRNYGSCVNRGLKEATGKYIKVLDADDSFDTKVFETFISYLKQIDVDLIISDYKTVNERGIEIDTYTFPLPTDHFFNLCALSKDTINWLWHQGVTYKTENLHRINYQQTEGISYTDDEWIFSPMSQVHKISYFPQFLYLYLIGREGQTFDPQIWKKAFRNRIVVAEKLLYDYAQISGHSTKEVQYYLTTKLIARLRVIYSFYLIKESTEENNQILYNLELTVNKLSSKIFKELDSIHKYGWYYVKIWRKSGCSQNTIMLCLLRILYQLKHILCQSSERNIQMPKSVKRKITSN